LGDAILRSEVSGRNRGAFQPYLRCGVLHT
jgi:hypothetical protein